MSNPRRSRSNRPPILASIPPAWRPSSRRPLLPALTVEQSVAVIENVKVALASMDPAEIAEATAEPQRQIYTSGIASAKAEVGLSFDMPPVAAVETLAQSLIPFSPKIVGNEVDAISAALQDGMMAGESISQLADRIQATFDDGMHIYNADGELAVNQGKSCDILITQGWNASLGVAAPRNRAFGKVGRKK